MHAAMALKPKEPKVSSTDQTGDLSRREAAAVIIQRAVRVFVMDRRLYILTEKRRREVVQKAGGNPFDSHSFGPDSLAARKPVEVAKYMTVCDSSLYLDSFMQA